MLSTSTKSWASRYAHGVQWLLGGSRVGSVRFVCDPHCVGVNREREREVGGERGRSLLTIKKYNTLPGKYKTLSRRERKKERESL